MASDEDYAEIEQLAKETAAALAEAYFGPRIKGLRDELTELRADIGELEERG